MLTMAISGLLSLSGNAITLTAMSLQLFPGAAFLAAIIEMLITIAGSLVGFRFKDDVDTSEVKYIYAKAFGCAFIFGCLDLATAFCAWAQHIQQQRKLKKLGAADASEVVQQQYAEEMRKKLAARASIIMTLIGCATSLAFVVIALYKGGGDLQQMAPGNISKIVARPLHNVVNLQLSVAVFMIITVPIHLARWCTQDTQHESSRFVKAVSTAAKHPVLLVAAAIQGVLSMIVLICSIVTVWRVGGREFPREEGEVVAHVLSVIAVEQMALGMDTVRFMVYASRATSLVAFARSYVSSYFHDVQNMAESVRRRGQASSTSERAPAAEASVQRPATEAVAVDYADSG
jgi:hypothetical protein